MVKYNILLVLLILLSSCLKEGKKSNNKLEKGINIEYNFLSLNNQMLKDQINLYYKDVEPKYSSDKILGVFYEKEDGKDIYRLRYMLNATSMYYYPVHFFFKVDDHVVGFNFLYLKDFKMQNKILAQVMKNYFPDDFEYYKEMLFEKKKFSDASINFNDEDLFPPPATGGYEVWKLVFKDGKLIKKEIGGWQ
jgi:hypothetical protein